MNSVNNFATSQDISSKQNISSSNSKELSASTLKNSGESYMGKLLREMNETMAMKKREIEFEGAIRTGLLCGMVGAPAGALIAATMVAPTMPIIGLGAAILGAVGVAGGALLYSNLW